MHYGVRHGIGLVWREDSVPRIPPDRCVDNRYHLVNDALLRSTG